jgi:phage-related baseplate assembly protein
MSNGTIPGDSSATGIQLPLFSFDSTIVPDIDFCVKDASQVESDVISNYEKYYYLITQLNKTLARGDPVRLFMLTIIYQLVVQRSIVDSTGKENLIKYAHGADLDNIGARWGQRGLRLSATFALTTLQFTLAMPVSTSVTVPLGTTAQTGDNHQFTTTQEGVLTAGQTTISLPAQAVVTGASENGFVAGQVNQLVSWSSPFLVVVTNTTTSSGGADTESDDHLRARIWMAPESFSAAGPYGAYEYWAASANPDIMDVAVWSDAAHAGQVYIYPLMSTGRLPTQAECDQVYAVCNDSKIRPLTDQVFVQAPIAVSYVIDMDYYIKTSDGQFAASIETACTQAYNDFITWQTTKIGRDINPSKLNQMFIDAGAKRTVIRAPVFTALTPQQIAVVDSVNSRCNYLGLEDE